MRKNSDRDVIARRATISRLHLQGYSGQEIAPKVGVSESQVSRDLKAISESWRESVVQDISEKRAQDLAELVLIRKELWEAWSSSKKRRGDPRYISEILKALKQAAELIGYHADHKIKINYDDLSEADLDHIIHTIITTHETNTTEK